MIGSDDHLYHLQLVWIGQGPQTSTVGAGYIKKTQNLVFEGKLRDRDKLTPMVVHLILVELYCIMICSEVNHWVRIVIGSVTLQFPFCLLGLLCIKVP